MENKFTDYMLNTIDKSVKNSAEFKNSGASIDWLKSSVKDLLNNKDSFKDANNAKIPTGMGKSSLNRGLDKNSIGRMYMYVYDPKHKDTLPYYDTLPLIFVVAFTADGFYGLNLHYVPPMVRSKIIEALTKNLNRAGITETRKVKMSYDILKRSSQFAVIKHCFKRYLFSHVRSSYMFIDPDEWNKTIMLPTERFKKQTKNTIYKNYTSGSARK